jgi:hypothetical protein
MQFPVLVIIPTNTPDVIKVIEQLMASYDAERSVLPYRVNITDEEKALIAQHYSLSLDDPGLFEAFSRWYEYPCERDERGDYYLSSDNPEGYWDGWLLHDQTDVYELPHPSMGNIDPLAIVTPDGLWHEMPYRWDEPAQQTAQRRQLVQQVLTRYTGYLAVLLHCHR